MRILVAGGQGQVGSALAQIGKEQGLDLIALGRSDLDITDAASIAAAFEKYQPELLINAAAYTAVDKAESEAELAYAINETATALLADACAAANIPMLHISTDYVFDGSKKGLYTEGDPVNPLAVYAKSKEAGERALRARVERHIILRTSWVFGAQGNNFVRTILRLAKERERLAVVDDQFGGPTSASSITKAIVAILDKYKKGDLVWGTYHYCQKPYVSWYEFAKVILSKAFEHGLISSEISLVSCSGKEYLTVVKRPNNSKLDTAKFEKCFGFIDLEWGAELDALIERLKTGKV